MGSGIPWKLRDESTGLGGMSLWQVTQQVGSPGPPAQAMAPQFVQERTLHCLILTSSHWSCLFSLQNLSQICLPCPIPSATPASFKLPSSLALPTPVALAGGQATLLPPSVLPALPTLH